MRVCKEPAYLYKPDKYNGDVMSEISKIRNCINIVKKENCCGCGACMNICEQKCISMKLDDEGFAYPQIDHSLCNNCGLCLEKCSMIHTISNVNDRDLYCYAAYSKDEIKNLEGSAGGIFELFCEVIGDMQGIVYGVSLDNGFQVRHHRASDLEEAKKFRKTKYLQSDTGDNFSLAQKDLEEGKTVLFSGTPCQIGGLYSFLGKDYPNLYTIDVFCHGVPSKRVFLKYLDALEEKYNSNAISICWKDKRDGWRPNKISVKFENEKEVITNAFCNSMHIGFLEKLYLRPSCYNCKYAAIPRIADISLGNFAEYDGKLYEQNQNKGLTMIVVSNKKGTVLFNKIKKKIFPEKVGIDWCKKKAVRFSDATFCSKNRENFMRDLKNGADFFALIKKYMAKECDLLSLEEFITVNEGNKFNVFSLVQNTGSRGNIIWERVSD